MQLLLSRSFIAILLTIGFYSATVCGQESRQSGVSTKAVEVKAFLNAIKSAEQNMKSGSSRSSHVESLINDVQPAVYVSSGTVKNYGEKPTVLYIDVNSLSSINSAEILSNNIEILTIKISANSGLNTAIDLSSFKKFPNLKYIYIISEVPASEGDIFKMLRNNNSQYEVFYKIEKGA
jgi:hypothetical protein